MLSTCTHKTPCADMHLVDTKELFEMWLEVFFYPAYFALNYSFREQLFQVFVQWLSNHY